MSADLRRLLEGATPRPWSARDVETATIGQMRADDALIVYLVNHAEALADLIDAAEEYTDCIAQARGQEFEDTAWVKLIRTLAALEGTQETA